MFIGHFAVGFVAKKYAQLTPLVLLLAAPLFADLLWPIFLLVGWEHVRIDPGNAKFTPLDLYDYPWSHSLLMDCVWATAFALIYLHADHTSARSHRPLCFRRVCSFPPGGLCQ